jgi:hypothetical protein
MASIEIKGVDELIRKLGKVEGVKVLEAPMKRSVYRLQRDMADYPAQRPGSSYVRTGTLGRRWTVKISRRSDGVEGRVGNNTVYAPFVQSHRFQARIHRGRWQTDAKVVDKNRQAIVADFERAIKQALK